MHMCMTPVQVYATYVYVMHTYIRRHIHTVHTAYVHNIYALHMCGTDALYTHVCTISTLYALHYYMTPVRHEELPLLGAPCLRGWCDVEGARHARHLRRSSRST